MYAGLAMFFALASPWRTYEVYQPTVERYWVAQASAQELKYNHCPTIAWFRDRWICLWNANQVPIEGRPGQLNYMSTSRDGKRWTRPVPAFASPEYSHNPVPCPKGTQWQPNLAVVGDELWAVWSQNSRDAHVGCYVSKLKEPGGKWANHRLLWDGQHAPLIDGERWRVFPTQNPIRLRCGRVLAPVTISSSKPAKDAPKGMRSWWAREKRDTVIYTDDGETWHVSPGAIQPERTWAQWEPTVWELPDGTVMMFSRNNDYRGRPLDGPRPAEMLLWSKSTDRGATWTPHVHVPLETVASRMHVLPCRGDRYMMVHNDSPAGPFCRDRLNLALFFTRGAGIDFVAGPGVSGNEAVVAYPQMWIHAGRLLVSYSQGASYRSIKVSHVTPLPDPKRYYLFPRDNTEAVPAPERVEGAFRFSGQQRVATKQPVVLPQSGFTLGAWVRPLTTGVLLDTRSTRPTSGMVWSLRERPRGIMPFVFFHTSERNIESTLPMARDRWSYLGLAVDNVKSTVTFYVNGQSETVAFSGPATKPLAGQTGYIGFKRFAGSALPGLRGDVRALAVYGEFLAGPREHAWLHNAFAGELGMQKLPDPRPPVAEPLVWLDPKDAAGLDRGFSLPADPSAHVACAVLDGVPVLRLQGDSSAGVDVDENHRGRGDVVELSFRFRIETGDQHVLCTVGDAVSPALVLHDRGAVWLQVGKTRARCGSATAGGWTQVHVASGNGETSVAVGASPPISSPHQAKATWVYLGEGYRQATTAVTSRFVVDVASVRSRVRGSTTP